MQIAIASGKGGAGKTCVTASLAAVWDRPQVAVDADVEAPNLHLFLHPQLTEERTAWLDVPQLSPEKCRHCDKCRDICSYKAIASFVGRISIFPDMCHGCNGCFAVCPSGVIRTLVTVTYHFNRQSSWIQKKRLVLQQSMNICLISPLSSNGAFPIKRFSRKIQLLN